MPKIDAKKPKLDNRGPAGLLKKIKGTKTKEVEDTLFEKAPKNRVPPGLKTMLVDIHSLVPDPVNARLHPERNLDAIMRSLAMYGQLKPVVVQKVSKEHGLKNRVVAGNGTMEAAKALGWTKLAANIMDMSDIDAAGYGLADNRTAELAKWDFEIVARLDLILQEGGQKSIGWTLDELEVLRAADWVAPLVEEEEFDMSNALTLKIPAVQREIVEEAISKARVQLGDNDKIADSECLVTICTEWLEAYSAKNT